MPVACGAVDPERPRVSRETRLLLAVLLTAVATLWVLARIRFPEQLPTPNPVPPVLAQLTPRDTLDDIVASVTLLQSRLSPSLIVIGDSRSTDAIASVLRFGDDLAVGLLPGARDSNIESTVLGHDPVSQPRASSAYRRATALQVHRRGHQPGWMRPDF